LNVRYRAEETFEIEGELLEPSAHKKTSPLNLSDEAFFERGSDGLSGSELVVAQLTLSTAPILLS